MDFVHDALADGRPFRVLTVVDQWSRQSPILEVAASLSGATVGAALDRVLPMGTAPRSITVDHKHLLEDAGSRVRLISSAQTPKNRASVCSELHRHSQLASASATPLRPSLA